MASLLFYFGIFISFLFHGTWSMIKPDINLQRTMTQVKNLTEWCDLMSMHPDECEKIIGEADVTEAMDESGEKVLVSGVDGKEIEMALFDACNVRELKVELPKHPVYDTLVWPPCTRVNRCGGCTTSDVFSCEPTEVREKFVKVIDSKLPYPGAQRFQFMGIRVVKIHEHLKCEAQCRIKAHDCNDYQWYDSHQCSCYCTDERKTSKGLCPDSHIWDESVCDCVCKDIHPCREPAYFHEASCKCTLKTGVSGEIDMDKLIEDLEKGIINKDNVLQSTIKNKTDTEASPVSEKVDSTGDESGSSDKAGSQTADGNVKIDIATEYVNETKEDIEKGKSNLSTPVAVTTKTTTTQAKTTTPSTTTANPCRHLKCFASWKPKLKEDGKCACFPPKIY